jgi:hypothetical protein
LDYQTLGRRVPSTQQPSILYWRLTDNMSSHSNPRRTPRTRLFKCFVLITLCCNAKIFEKPHMSHCMRLWMTRNTGIMSWVNLNQCCVTNLQFRKVKQLYIIKYRPRVIITCSSLEIAIDYKQRVFFKNFLVYTSVCNINRSWL